MLEILQENFVMESMIEEGLASASFFYFKSIAMCSPASSLKGRIIDLDPENDRTKQNFDAYLT